MQSKEWCGPVEPYEGDSIVRSELPLVNVLWSLLLRYDDCRSDLRTCTQGRRSIVLSAHIAFGNEENLEDCFGVELEHFIWLAKLKGSLSNVVLNGEG